MAVLGVFARVPEPGKVKTRLARSIGDTAALECYRCMLADLLEKLAALDATRVLAYTPAGDAAREVMRSYAGSRYRLWAQPSGDLGHRLDTFFRHWCTDSSNTGQGCIAIGSDAPTVPLDCVRQAFELCQHYDCVLGPALDGGYYLIGLNRPLPLFGGVEWGGPRVLEQTLALAERYRLSVGFLPTCPDVDTVEDLRIVYEELRAGAGEAPRLLEFLRRLFGTSAELQQTQGE